MAKDTTSVFDRVCGQGRSLRAFPELFVYLFLQTSMYMFGCVCVFVCVCVREEHFTAVPISALGVTTLLSRPVLRP